MTTTKHADKCKMAFGRYDPYCLRCQELIAGASPRKSWNALKKVNETKRLQEIREHDCKKCNCGPVCTAFDW